MNTDVDEKIAQEALPPVEKCSKCAHPFLKDKCITDDYLKPFEQLTELHDE